MKWVVYAVLGGASCVACGGAGEVGKPIAQFPSQADLNGLAASQPAALKSEAGMANVDSWDMQAPVAAPQYPTETTWDRLVTDTGRSRGGRVVLSPALRCAAQEAARFYTVNSGMPDDGLREHLLLRCGATLPAHGFTYMSQDVPDNVPDAQLESAVRASVQKVVDKGLAIAGSEFGLGAARGHGRYAVVAFSGLERARIAPFSPVVQGDSVTLSGELKGPAAYIVALATQGPYGVAHCEIDPMSRLPRFKVTCPVAADDATTRIEVATKEDGRVLMEPVVELEVRHDDQAELQYKAASYGSNKAVANSAEFRRELLADLNQVRNAAGLQPFALEAQESQTEDRLAPVLFQSLHSNDEQQQATITLGLLAGWDVHGGLIRDGGFFESAVNTSRNPSRWLTQALASPLGRWVLLEPSMSRIGIGASELTPAGEMAIVTTYSFFGSNDHHAEEDAVLAELDRQRRAHGVQPVKRRQNDAAMQHALRDVNTNAVTSLTGLHNVMQAAVSPGRSVSGYLLETTDVKLLKFDPMFLDASTLEVEVGVTHYRAPGAAWGQYAILFVVTNHGARTSTAKRTNGKRGAL